MKVIFLNIVFCMLLQAEASFAPTHKTFLDYNKKFNNNQNRNLFWFTTATKKTPDQFCIDKEDDGLYEHDECKKYWHCLYVGTIFQSAVERKCPIGTMFHPLLGQCEISTVVI